MALYNAYGQINTTVVSGASYTGLYAADGSYNVVLNDGSAITGLMHPCGAYNVVLNTSINNSNHTPNGGLYVSPGVSPSGFVLTRPSGAYTSDNNGIRNYTITGAVPGTPGTLPTNWAQTNNTSIVPNVIGTGTDVGIPYVDIQFVGTSAGGTNNNIFEDANNVIAASAGQTWTYGQYINIQAGDFTNIGNVLIGAMEYNSGGTQLASGAADLKAMIKTSATPFNQCYVTQTRTLSNASTAFTRPLILLNLAAAPTAVNVTLRIGWPSLKKVF